MVCLLAGDELWKRGVNVQEILYDIFRYITQVKVNDSNVCLGNYFSELIIEAFTFSIVDLCVEIIGL